MFIAPLKRSLISILDMELPFFDQLVHLRFLAPRLVNIFDSSLAVKKAELVYPHINAEAIKVLKGIITKVN